MPIYLVQSDFLEQMVLGYNYLSAGVDIIFSTGSEVVMFYLIRINFHVLHFMIIDFVVVKLY